MAFSFAAPMERGRYLGRRLAVFVGAVMAAAGAGDGFASQAGGFSASYAVDHRVLDGGGGRAVGSRFAMDASLGNPGGVGGGGSGMAVRQGYAGQINDAPFVAVAVPEEITRTNAVALGFVNANGRAATVHFEFGPTDTYGSTAAVAGPIAGNLREAVSALLSVLSPGVVYHVRIVAANEDGIARSGGLTFAATTNFPPLAVSDVVVRRPGVTAKVAIVDLLANDSDPEEDAISFRAFVSPTEQGGLLARDGGWLLYTPPEGLDGSDSFTYTIEDSFGAVSPGVVAIVVVPAPDNEPGKNIALIHVGPDGKTVVRFAGVPHRPFRVQWTDSLETPVHWASGPVVTVGPNGLVEHVDEEPPPLNGRFFRVIPHLP